MPGIDFSGDETARLAGIAYPTLDRWVREKAVPCDVPAEGTGSRRRFSFRDVVLVTLARTLRDRGLSMMVISRILTLVRDNWEGDDPDAAGYLVIQSWTETIETYWLDEPVSVNAYFTAARSRKDATNQWTGVVSAVDLAFIARSVLKRVEAGVQTLKQPAGRSSRSGLRARPISFNFAIKTYSRRRPGSAAED